MSDLSNEELKTILENRIKELENSSFKEEKIINTTSVNFLLKTLALPSDFAPLAQRVFELSPRLSLLWIHLAECTGCSESLFRTDLPDLAELIFDFFSFEYQETFMAAAGWQAEENIDKLLASGKDYILAVEGGVSPLDSFFFTVGAHGLNSYEALQKTASKAKAIFAIGTCSSYGGIQAADPNPTKACGIQEVLSKKVVQIPGCPPSDVNIIASLCFYALFRILPNLDEKNRPKWAYGKCLHDMCERKAKFEAGVFASSFDDDLAKNGACLFKVGCKGVYTYNNCPKVKFNAKTSWSVQGGHGCIACSEPHFWDNFGSYEEPMNNIFAYRDFSFKNLALEYDELDNTLNENNVLLRLDESLSIVYKNARGELCEFLNFEFESNVKLVLAHLSKNKIGASLVEAYKKEFSSQFAFIEANYDEIPRPSSDLFKFFEYIYVLARGEYLKDYHSFFDFAKAYKFKHESPFDIKLSLSENTAKLDLSKAMRMPLIYLCGGLELEALAFSACKIAFASLHQALQSISQKENKNIALSFKDELDLDFVKANLLARTS